MQTRLTTKLGQKLALTPQLTQSLKILSMNSMELDQYIDECIESNPMIESESQQHPEETSADENVVKDAQASEMAADSWESVHHHAARDGDDLRDQQWSDPQSLDALLHEQIDRQPMSEDVRHIAHAIIDSLDDDGYFRDTKDLATEFHIEPEAVVRVLEDEIHKLEPAGIGARDLMECLLLQLDDEADNFVRELLLKFSDELMLNDDALIAATGCSTEVLKAARQRMRRLDPFPGHGMHGQENVYIRSEMIFRQGHDNEILVEIPGRSGGSVRLNEQWQNQKWQGADRKFMDEAIKEAKWLLYAISQRQETMHKVAHCLARRQKAFIQYGFLGLKPLTLQDVADEISMHESTISRVTSGKYAETPFGMIELKRFFSSGLPTRGGGMISVYRVQQRVKSLIASEPTHRPISDQAIAERLQAEGIEIARRTVAKYRGVIGVPPGSVRKRSVAVAS
ncbi:MAG: RNA polymerase factor sigma-54 [Mariprofundaceae bacterium]